MDVPESINAPRTPRRRRLERLRDEITHLSNAIRDELDWRDRLYPVSYDADEDDEAV
jgi:hypothetical protein